MKKKGQAAVYGLMVAIFVILVSIMLAEPLRDTIDIGRSPSNLDCGNSSISTGTKLSCLVVDLTMPYFLAVVIVAGAGYVFVRRITQ